MTASAVLENARTMALAYLARFPHPSDSDVDRAVNFTVAGLAATGEAIDASQLRRRLEADVNVFVGHGAVLEDHDANHRPWLDAKRADIDWRFWNAYRDWIRATMPPEVPRGIDR